MTTETLSQQEIDLLFGAGGSAPAQPADMPEQTPVEVQVYDFRRPNRISKERQRSLEAMYGLMAKSLESWLAGRIRTQLSVDLLSVEQFSFAEFLLSLSTPCSSFVYDLTEDHQGVIDFGPDFSFFLVDRLLGGSGRFAPQDRALTPLERLIVRMVADRAAQSLGEVWHDHVPLSPTLNRFESVPEMLQIVNREDPVLVATFQVVAGPFRNLLPVCMPFLALEKFFTSAGTRRVHVGRMPQVERDSDRQSMDAALRATRMAVQVRLPSWNMSLRDLAALRPGSLLHTPVAAGSEAEVFVAGQHRFRGRAGRYAGRVAVALTDCLEPDPTGTPTG